MYSLPTTNYSLQTNVGYILTVWKKSVKSHRIIVDTMPNSETKTCQNCKQNFAIEPEDFDFYAKIKVPAPTFCPQCRWQRRLMFRNERSLYMVNCGLCGDSTLSTFTEDSGYVIYCPICYRSEDWDPMDYGINYDFSFNVDLSF